MSLTNSIYLRSLLLAILCGRMRVEGGTGREGGRLATERLARAIDTGIPEEQWSAVSSVLPERMM